VTEPLDWLLTDFVNRVPGCAHVVAVSADGLALAVSDGLPAERADQLAAITAGLASLTDGAGSLFSSGRVVQTAVEMDAGILLMMSIGARAHLAALAGGSCDLGQLGYEMSVLRRRVGAALSPDARD
jgi:uncharacterized protein